MMSLKAIMLQKGSKCKCKQTDPEDIFTKNEKGDFEEISMNSSQDHSIDR
jgi:hypothetical protein